MLLAAVVGCSAPEKPSVERVSVPELRAPSAKLCGTPIGPARTWDFTGGKTPAEGRFEKLAVSTSEGMGCADVTNMNVRTGFWLDKPWTPEGAFLFEAEVKLGDVARSLLKRQRGGLLWDDMGVNYQPKRDNRGFEVELSQGPAGSWTPTAYFGMGTTTCSVVGPASVRFKKDETVRIALFFGANGRVVFEFGGQVVERTIPVVGPVVPSGRRPVIGSRQTSYYHHFDGVVRKVSFTPMRIDPVGMASLGPIAFPRGSAAERRFAFSNSASAPMDDVRVSVEQFCGTGRVRAQDFSLGTIAAAGRAELSVPLETRVRPGWHPIRLTVRWKGGRGEDLSSEKVFRYGIGPAPADRMMTLMWGFGDDVEDAAALGFTHALSYRAPQPVPDDDRLKETFDNAAVAGLGITRSVRPIFPTGKDKQAYLRRTRDGKNGFDRHFEVPEVSNPELRELIRKVATDDADAYAAYPAFAGMLPCSEIRDAAFPSFNTEHLRYKAETGREVPSVVERSTLRGQASRDMRARYPDGVVPADDPVLAFYDWYWSGGDGWPGYISAVADAYRARIGRKDFFSFWDPAVRCPPHWGSGGSADMLNQWCYAVPEPMNVAGPCEEMFAMAAGRPGQQVAIMTQLICYRSQMAPKEVKVTPEPEWVKRLPDAAFPTIPPDTLQEAVWSMLAKPIQAVMFHGWGTIHDTGEREKYCFTNPESRERIRHLLRDVIAPLGPTLKRLGRKAQPVAVLESFATAAFGGPASWGWKAPAITFLQRARLDPRVVYEQTILRDGLDDVKVLYAPQCWHLTAPVVEKVRAFQRRGGILVADEQCLRALKPDVTVPLISFDPPPASDHTEEVDEQEAAKSGDAKTRQATVRAKSTMLAAVEKIRNGLSGRYAPEVDSSTPEIVTYSRRWKDVPYVVAVNDRRTFGDYVGLWGKTMEKGLPQEGEVTLAASAGSVGAVYELSRGGRVAFSEKEGRVAVPLRFETNDGRLLAFLPRPIAAVEVEASKSVKSGGRIHVKFTVKDDAGSPVPALLPVDIRVFDAAGRELDGAGYACAEGGVSELDVLTNLDDAPGGYRVTCRDRASGLVAETTVKH